MSRLTRAGLPNPSRETKFSGTNADREIFIFPVPQLTTCRTGNLTRSIHTLALCVTIHTSFPSHTVGLNKKQTIYIISYYYSRLCTTTTAVSTQVSKGLISAIKVGRAKRGCACFCTLPCIGVDICTDRRTD